MYLQIKPGLRDNAPLPGGLGGVQHQDQLVWGFHTGEEARHPRGGVMRPGGTNVIIRQRLGGGDMHAVQSMHALQALHMQSHALHMQSLLAPGAHTNILGPFAWGGVPEVPWLLQVFVCLCSLPGIGCAAGLYRRAPRGRTPGPIDPNLKKIVFLTKIAFGVKSDDWSEIILQFNVQLQIGCVRRPISPEKGEHRLVLLLSKQSNQG